MYDNILREMRARVRRGNLVITVHGRQEMFSDGLLAVDVERCILTGAIVERQWDDEFAEHKYLIEGETTELKSSFTSWPSLARITPWSSRSTE